jgi:hypothetical protein
MAFWEEKDDLCDLVKQELPFNNYQRLLDLIEMHIFDFAMGNVDRLHYETYKYFGKCWRRGGMWRTNLPTYPVSHK